MGNTYLNRYLQYGPADRKEKRIKRKVRPERKSERDFNNDAPAVCVGREGIVRQTMNGNLRIYRVANVCKRSMIDEPRFFPYL